LVGSRQLTAGGPDAIDTLCIPGRLGRFSEVVGPRPQVQEDVGSVAVSRLGLFDIVPQVIGARQADRHAANPVLAKVRLAVVVEVFRDGAGETAGSDGC